MDVIRQFGERLNWRYLVLVVVAWWLIMLIVYAILSARIADRKDRIRSSGVKITNEFADLVSLPLLERNSQSIHKLLTAAASRTGVIYASVVDHRNKVVAFTGTGHLMPDITAAARSVEKVSIWEGGFASHAKIVNFVSDITYAGTKIGEIFIGLATPEAIQTRKQFMLVAVTSGLVLLILISIWRYPSIKASLTNVLNVGLARTAKTANEPGSPVVCPLCGERNALSRTIFKRSNLDKFLISGPSIINSNVGGVLNSPPGGSQPKIKSEDLSWLRRRIILRCTEIIKKLAA